MIQLPLRQWASGCGESAAGGRELVMLTKGDGASCHYVSVENGHVDVVRACWQKRRRVLPHSPVPALPLKRQLIVPLESA